MLSLLIEDRDLVIKDIYKPQLAKIIDWFNSSNKHQYRYAMGINKSITIEDIYEKYLEVLINAQEFFLSINLEDNFVGFVKGRADFRDKGEIWIMSMLIDTPYQNMGIGKRVLKLIINEFNERLGITEFYACLVDENVQAKTFWEKNGFNEHRTTPGYFTIDNANYDLIIVRKQLRYR